MLKTALSTLKTQFCGCSKEVLVAPEPAAPKKYYMPKKCPSPPPPSPAHALDRVERVRGEGTRRDEAGKISTCLIIPRGDRSHLNNTLHCPLHPPHLRYKRGGGGAQRRGRGGGTKTCASRALEAFPALRMPSTASCTRRTCATLASAVPRTHLNSARNCSGHSACSFSVVPATPEATGKLSSAVSTTSL